MSSFITCILSLSGLKSLNNSTFFMLLKVGICSGVGTGGAGGASAPPS